MLYNSCTLVQAQVSPVLKALRLSNVLENSLRLLQGFTAVELAVVDYLPAITQEAFLYVVDASLAESQLLRCLPNSQIFSKKQMDNQVSLFI
jgi:hypothetical protein